MIRYFVLLFVLLLSVVGTFGQSNQDVINVHVVCHTHDDVGWLKTVDQYFMGANNSIQHAGVQYILDSVVQSLVEDPARKFIYVEIAFFWRWWNQQSAETQETVKKLVANGQLEFISGGWCMHDEAAPYYSDMIDQMTLGHQFLQQTFGVTPRIGWQIDPFGHSSTNAALSAQMGFDGLFFARIDYQDFERRRNASEFEFIWRGSRSLGQSADLFTGVLYTGYGNPDGFCFDQGCTDPPIQDDPRIFGYNVKERADVLVANIKEQNSHYRGNHIMLTMGSDFQYENANTWYKNLDKLMNYINGHPEYGVNMFYSTPSQYVDAKNNAGLQWTVKEDDLFPYADGPHAYWTGYFTSRVALKGMVRTTSSVLRTCQQLQAFVAQPYPETGYPLPEAQGVVQHHDGVSGTSQQHVADDYALRLSLGQDSCQRIASQAFNELAGQQQSSTWSFCPLLNESVCESTQMATGPVTVLIYNSLANARAVHVHLPVASANWAISSSTGEPLVFQVTPTWLSDSRANPNSAPYSLTFQAQLPALGFATFTLSPKSPHGDAQPVAKQQQAVNDDVVVENSLLKMVFSGATQRLSSVTDKKSQTTVAVDHQFVWFNSSTGTPDDGQPGGAYIMRTNNSVAIELAAGSLEVVQGPLFSEVRQVFGKWVTAAYRLYQDQAFIELDYTVGPIDVSDGLGKEVISRFSTDLNSRGAWYTDANGREMQTRQRNFRPTWNLTVTEFVAGNFDPVNAITLIRDEDGKGRQFGLVTDRSQAAASLLDGQLDVLVHRRLLAEDERGVGEALDEPGRDGKGLVLRARHLLFVQQSTQSSATMQSLRLNNQGVQNPALVSFSASSPALPAFSHAVRNLPTNVHLLNLQRFPSAEPTTSHGGDDFLIRFAHLFSVEEDPALAQTVSFPLSSVFPAGLVIASVQLMSLTANQLQSNVHRLQWNIVSNGANMNQQSGCVAMEGVEDYLVTIDPMDIVTLRVKTTSSQLIDQSREVNHFVRVVA